MARTQKRRRKSSSEDTSVEEQVQGLNPETKRGIAVVALLVVSVLLFLSFFGIAGALGKGIELGLSLGFGWDRFLIPVLLIIIGGTLMFPERGQLSKWNYIGLASFFLAFNGLLNLILVNRPEAITSDVSLAGGYFGQILGLPLPSLLGFWGSLVTLAAILLVGVLLLFNTSLRSLVGAHQHLTGWFGATLHRRGSTESEEEDEEESEEEEPEAEDEEEDAEEPKRKFFRPKPASPLLSGDPEDDEGEEEKAVTTRRRRMVSIPMDLLDHKTSKANSGNIEENKKIIKNTFEQFGVDVEMDATATGPTVTQYTLRPSQGVKLSKIINLQNDLALALAAHPIRIEAPIPGKSLVGIEVPNQKAATVTLRELLESREFSKRKTPLSVPLGKDVSGKASVIAIEKMPHLLVAGATGSGKSVCVNTVIVSLLYQNGPDDLKFIMVDPKRVELTAYEGIPHLLIPPITKVEDTINALKWTVREMERRLDILSKFGARDIISYNDKAEEKMPKIVVIIDELADLMTTSSKDVEGAIVRIAQMARATGIHLILATQRPSVDVITGLIKANIPGRIAFSVASQMDSRTILDTSGAEKLLGRGDMLLASAELSKPRRLQGAFVTEDEVNRVVEFLKKQGQPDYNHDIVESPKSSSVFDGSGDEDEPLLEDAIQIVVDAGKGSTSLLQRRLKVGYSRAARIMDILEEQGIVGPSEGSKPRDVLIDEWPIGGEDPTEGMPTAQDDLDEAEAYDDGGDDDYTEDDVFDEEDDDTPPEDEDVEETVEKRGVLPF